MAASMSVGSTSETFTRPNLRRKLTVITWRAIASSSSPIRATAAARSHEIARSPATRVRAARRRCVAGPDDTVYISWRHVLPGNFRHIAITSSTDAGATFSKPVIVSDDKWMLEGCPVSGPALSVAENGVLKVVWYAAGEGNAPGLYMAESKDKGQNFSPRQLLAQESVRGTPVLASSENAGIAVWETTGGAAARDEGS